MVPMNGAGSQAVSATARCSAFRGSTSLAITPIGLSIRARLISSGEENLVGSLMSTAPSRRTTPVSRASERNSLNL